MEVKKERGIRVKKREERKPCSGFDVNSEGQGQFIITPDSHLGRWRI